uniref:(northern house mosquito) hypothetical protein n=1 Tax=Culex pipiens TaxID=7175 RepID=A0A8D8DMG4_CULPI
MGASESMSSSKVAVLSSLMSPSSANGSDLRLRSLRKLESAHSQRTRKAYAASRSLRQVQQRCCGRPSFWEIWTEAQQTIFAARSLSILELKSGCKSSGASQTRQISKFCANGSAVI